MSGCRPSHASAPPRTAATRTEARSVKKAGSAITRGAARWRRAAAGSGLHDRDHEPDRGQDVADAHALGLGPDLHDGLAAVVDLPGELPALRLAARDRLLELTHDLIEGVTVAVVQHGHPRRGDRVLDRLLDVGVGSNLLRARHSRVYGTRPR